MSLSHGTLAGNRFSAGDLFENPSVTAPSLAGASECMACGACCSYSSEWPRFSTEDESQLDRIPAKYISRDQSGMRCDGGRCAALAGKVGKRTSCGIYDIRPDVCRACMPGGEDCRMARHAFGLPPLMSV